MAESRRIPFTTLSCDIALPSSSLKPASAPKKPPPGVPQVKESRSDTGTVRLVLDLSEPDERTFPEFNYSELVENKINCLKAEIPPSGFEEEERREEDEVAAIARKLEEKYGGKPKKKKDRIQDLIDIGYGYDDEDSFIDNSEAYDEFVPASITTKFGGFYINSGVLHFRQVSDTEDLTQDKSTPELSKKRKLNGGRDKPKKKPCREDKEVKNTDDQKSSALSEVKPGDELTKKKKKKKAAGTLSVTSMLKKFQREKEKERQEMARANQRAAAIRGVPTIPLCPADAAGGGGSGLTDPLLSLIGSTNDQTLIQAANTMDFVIDLDSLLEDSEESSKTVSLTAAETQPFQPKTDDQAQCEAAHSGAQTLKTESEQTQLPPQTSSTSAPSVPLPEGLSAGLEGSIRKLVVAAKTSEGESKLKFFTPEINSILLEIELQCREQGGQLRSKVYSHLTSFLPCSRDTLLKRVKKLFAAHTGPPNVEDPVHKLKEAIGKAMPEQIVCFLEKCQAYEQTKTSRMTVEEGNQEVNVVPEENVEEKGGKRGGPKKLFTWNEEIRECLCNVLKAKMEGYKKEKTGSQEMEEYLKTLLDNEVKPLWPKGWMQSRVLLRESKKILGPSASLLVKRARPEKKQQSSVCSPSDVGSGICRDVQDPPLQSKAADEVLTMSPDILTFLALDGLKNEVPAESDKSPVTTASAPTASLLDVLADQGVAQGQPLFASQELLAAALAKYQHSARHKSFSFDAKSPALPPPPPQTSPVRFPVGGVCQGVVPQMLQIGDFARNLNAGQALNVSDSDTTIQ
ncbi:ubinuclein-1-like [Xyrichtys novacula]|uniref:Ubinuclein-1-like n=1 Tax=Xyrichtys novacula TaxID=13765 RepID=A0AAV1EZE8_XYRNO|nr:ubinuclein-1-like [Xyrichtys novacula]